MLYVADVHSANIHVLKGESSQGLYISTLLGA